MTRVALRESGVPWIGLLPRHWRVRKVKFQADFTSAKVASPPPGSRYVGLEHIESRTGKFLAVQASMQTESESTVNQFRKGDVLFGKLRPYLAKAAVADTDGFCSSEILVLRPQALLADYLKLAMLLDGFIQTVDSSTYGSKMPRADAAFISQISLPEPPFEEQIAIAAYLDTETKRIDDLIQEKQRLVSLLHELRGSIVRELTAGLHINGPRCDTGNVFTPAIPSTWQLVPIGRYSCIGNGSTPLKDNADYWEGGNYPWLNSAVVNQDEVHEGSEFVTESALRQCHLPIVPAGSVLIALTGQGKTRGQVTVLRIEATINQHLASIRPDPEKLDGEFVFWALSGQYQALRMVSDGQGGTKGALTCDELARFQIPLPSIEEQRAIAARLYEDTRRVDELVDHAKCEVELLREMRSVTITDAVLGRIDVRNNAKIEPAREAIA